jgi:nucleoside-diphosphate-sugar epimerase
MRRQCFLCGIQILREVLAVPRLALEDPDQRSNIVSNERIETTGFKPSVSLDEGIDELIKGYWIIRRNQYSNV